MPGQSGTRPGGIGDRRHLHHGLGAVDELDQHARVHVPALGLLHVVVGRRIDVERVVLALAGGDDGIAEAGDEVDEFHGGGGLVAGAQRIDDAEPLGLALRDRRRW